MRLTYAGLNFVDVYQRQGGRQAPNLPAVLGKGGRRRGQQRWAKASTGLKVGQRVAFGTAARGAYAESINVPAWQLAPVPDAVRDEQAAAIMLQGMTAHYLTHSTFALQAGQLAVDSRGSGGCRGSAGTDRGAAGGHGAGDGGQPGKNGRWPMTWAHI